MQGYAVGTVTSPLMLPPPPGPIAVCATGGGDDELETQVGKFVSGTFFGMMVKAMRSTLPKDGLLSGGRGEEVFRNLFDRELADRFADGARFPAVEAAIRQLSGNRVYRQKMPHRWDEPAMAATGGGQG